jgi:hypothetical protein
MKDGKKETIKRFEKQLRRMEKSGVDTTSEPYIALKKKLKSLEKTVRK